jgi:hypothetical protein
MDRLASITIEGRKVVIAATETGRDHAQQLAGDELFAAREATKAALRRERDPPDALHLRDVP